MNCVSPISPSQPRFAWSHSCWRTSCATDIESSWEVFPEGGNLVVGVLNRVGIRGPVNSQADITTGSGKIVGKVTTGPTGQGIFSILPNYDDRYQIRTGLASVPIPDQITNGIALQLDHIDKHLAEVRLHGTPAFATKTVLLTIIHHSTISLSAEIKLNSYAQGKVRIPLKDIPDGVVVAALWDEKEKLLAERLFFNRQGETKTITNHQLNYLPREKIRYDVGLSNPNSSGSFSIRVIAADLFGSVSGPGYARDLMLWQDIGFGMITRNDNITSTNDLDVLLLTSTWGRYDLRKLLTSLAKPDREITSGFSITGRVLDTSDQPNTTEVWMFLEEEGLVVSAPIETDGTFEIPLPYELNGIVRIYYQVIANGKKITESRIELDSHDTIEQPLYPNTLAIDVSNFTYRSFNERVRQINKVYSTFSKSNNMTTVAHSPMQLTSQPDVTIVLDDFQRFNTLEETIREVLPLMKYRKTRTKNEIRIWHDDINQMADGSPLFIIDGRTTDDIDFFMNIPVSDIESISIFASKNRLASFGALGQNGIVVVNTFSRTSHIPRTNRLELEGLQKSRPFQNVTEGTIKNQSTPIFRSCPYWNPHIRIDKNAKHELAFYAPDNPGMYLIQTDGVTDDGKTISETDTIYVRHDPN